MSTAQETHSDHAEVHPESRAYYLATLAEHEGQTPDHNQFVKGVRVYSEGRVSRTRARADWHRLTGIPVRPRATKGASRMPITQPTGPVLVPPTETQRHIARQDARIASVEQAQHDMYTTLASVTTAQEADRQITRPLAQLRTRARTDPDTAEAMTRGVRLLAQGNKKVFFLLMELFGLPLSPNDERERQSLFLQGVLT